MNRNEWNNNDNDWFFDNFDKAVNSGTKGFLGLGCLALLANFLFLGALIVLGAWAIGKFVV